MAQPTAVDRLYEEIHALSKDDRALLLDRLWADEWRDVPGFEHPIEDEEYWREEIARRAEELRDHPTAGLSLEESLRQARAALGQRAHV